MAPTRPTQPKILSAMEPNVHHLANRPLLNRKPITATRLPTSPLKKQSDYEVVAPLASKPKATLQTRTLQARTAATARAPVTPQIKKVRKKYLCATPPQILQDLKGKREYDRGRQLGEGGFARCFLVQNKNGVLFAAKTVSKKSLDNSRMKSKFFGELQVHKTMLHPNIVRFVEVFEDDDNVYMILELCHNKSLMDMLRRRKRFTEPETRFFILQLMGALKYMHGKNVIHRDLKLGNIFLDQNMNVKIGDFGLAALLVDENERKRTICGTPNYIAPEVLFGSGKGGDGHSFGVDLWGVGIIMYAMLIGKPPFQSTNVDTIYDKIRDNTFEWPDNIVVSSSAKSLVNSLLNRDPNARPSLDDIANHHFFKSGLFPRSIPTSATLLEPSWPSAGPTLTAAAASRAEWKKNYDEVAKAAGVGIDSTGRPVMPVGDKVGKPIEPVPISRPASAASSASSGECADIGRILEKKRKEQQLKDEALKANGGYVLPEALSPRDGHARMRNMSALRRVPSRLGALKGNTLSAGVVPPQEVPPAIVIPEETEPEESKKDEPEPPPPRTRQLDKQPIRRSSAETREVTTAMAGVHITRTTGLSTALPPKRVTRSHAAQQRAAAAVVEPSRPLRTVATEPTPALVPAPAPVRRFTSMEARRPVSPLPENVPSARPSLTSEAPPKERITGSSSPGSIPFGSSLSSRVGKPITETTTSAVISSLQPIINSLTAFTTGNIHSLPTQPAATIAAVRAFRSGQKNKAVFIKKWVDYTNKYGMAYMLTDGTCATLYNDNTSLIVDDITGERVEWITHSASEPARIIGGYQETVFRRLSTEMSVIKQRSGTSKGLKSKLMIWRRTSNYMNNCLGITEHWGCGRKESIREPTVDSLSDVMLWVTQYARLRRCVVFRFIDGTIQLNFIDHTKLILTSAGRTLRLVTKDNDLFVFSLEEAYEKCRSGDSLVEDFGLKQKIGYVKEILRSWYRTGRFPGDMDAKEGEAHPLVILGEGPA